MSSLKAKIVKQLDYLPETALKQVWDLIEFLTWRKESAQIRCASGDRNAWLETDLSNLGYYEPYEWQLGELEEGLPIQIDPETGVVIVE